MSSALALGLLRGKEGRPRLHPAPGTSALGLSSVYFLGCRGGTLVPFPSPSGAAGGPRSAPPFRAVCTGLPGFCLCPRGPDSHRPGRTSPPPARRSATGAARGNWRPSLRASTKPAGPGSPAPSRTGPASCRLPASSGCPARARGVSLPGAEDALGRESGTRSAVHGQGTEGWGGGERGAPARTGRGSWGAVGYGEREGLGRIEGYGSEVPFRDRVEPGPGQEPLGLRLSPGWVQRPAKQGLEGGLFPPLSGGGTGSRFR